MLIAEPMLADQDHRGGPAARDASARHPDARMRRGGRLCGRRGRGAAAAGSLATTGQDGTLADRSAPTDDAGGPRGERRSG